MPLQRIGDAAEREALIAFIAAASAEAGAGLPPSIDAAGVSASESPKQGDTP
jgi:hypothetical protein